MLNVTRETNANRWDDEVNIIHRKIKTTGTSNKCFFYTPIDVNKCCMSDWHTHYRGDVLQSL